MKKYIHYFWFGGSELPKKSKCYIESWKKYFPDFEIKRWDESNFDVGCNKYVRQAYEDGKWAFVSDYARFFILEKFGGLYLDVDVEVIKPFGELLEYDAFAGFETKQYVNPGLALWSKEPGHPVIKAMREKYDSVPYADENGNRIKINVCGYFTSLLENYGFRSDGSRQSCGGVELFPVDYFNPFDDATGRLHVTENSYTIHWYDKSWMSAGKKLRNRFTRILHRCLGTDIRERITGKDGRA